MFKFGGSETLLSALVMRYVSRKSTLNMKNGKQLLSDQQTAMQPRPTQYTVQNKTKGTEGLIYNII